jgi:N-acetyl-gamma-glutamyl-phosphate reductase
VTSESRPGQNLGDIHPFSSQPLDLTLESFNAKRLAETCDVAFFALPHGVGSKNIADFVAQGKRAMDLSADFRLKNVKTYEAWYKVKHASPALVEKGGLRSSRTVSKRHSRDRRSLPTPAVTPPRRSWPCPRLLRRKWLTPGLWWWTPNRACPAREKAGSDVSLLRSDGKLPSLRCGKHRHVPEIEQVLADQSGRATSLTFVPHLVPMTRGILVTAYGTLKKKMTTAAVRQAFEEDYGGERFIRLLPEGRWPQTKDTAGTNYVDINVTIDERNRRVVVLAALDNLVKGASGQAVQNMNLLFGLSEALGIK